MQSVFSHIVQKRFSQEYENIATDALAYILAGSQSARDALMKILRGLIPDLPDLHFRTQQTEGNMRPDMWGYDGGLPRVFIENKFWAGLTDNQPVSYLQELARGGTQSTILLFIVPGAREEAVWRELIRRIADAGISTQPITPTAAIVHATASAEGPMLALTSWERVLSALEIEADDEPGTRSDLLQLRALCDVAKEQAFVPFSPTELTDQRTPQLMIQLGLLVQSAIDQGVTEGFLTVKDLRPQASWDRFGRYFRFGGDKGVGAWLGVRHDLWMRHGLSPIWLSFSQGVFGRALEVRKYLEPWAAKAGLFIASENEVVVAVEIQACEERDVVVNGIASRLKDVWEVLVPITG